MTRVGAGVPWSLVVCIALAVSGVCKSQVTTKKPVVTYVAGPNQLTLLLDESAFRFGYDTDNQFRAERRFPNGTVAGYYGYIRADGKPVRVKYGAVDDLGFTAIQEIIPNKFPEEPNTTETSAPEGSGSEASNGIEEEKQKDIILLPQNEPIIDDEKESVSVDASDFLREGLLRVEGTDRFIFPKIDVPDLPRRKSRSAQWLEDAAPIPVQRAAQRRIVAEKHGSEPTIIYAEPIPLRFIKTASTRFNTN